MEPRHISAVNYHPIDLRAAHPNVLEHVVIERMKLAYRHDACASDGMGAPPLAGRGEDRLGKGADDSRSAAGSVLQRAQDGADEVLQRLGAGGLAAADQVLLRPLPLVGRQAPVINPIVETNRSLFLGHDELLR